MFDHYREFMDRQVTRMIYQLPRRRAPENQFTNFMLARERSVGLDLFAGDRPDEFLVPCATCPGGEGDFHTVRTQNRRAIECDCKSFRYRVTCLHAERTNRHFEAGVVAW